MYTHTHMHIYKDTYIKKQLLSCGDLQVNFLLLLLHFICTFIASIVQINATAEQQQQQ